MLSIEVETVSCIYLLGLCWCNVQQSNLENNDLCFCRKISDDHWLLDFCCFILSEETDGEAKNKLIEMLQASLSDSEGSLVDVAGFELVSVILLLSSACLNVILFKSCIISLKFLH